MRKSEANKYILATSFCTLIFRVYFENRDRVLLSELDLVSVSHEKKLCKLEMMEAGTMPVPQEVFSAELLTVGWDFWKYECL